MVRGWKRAALVGLLGGLLGPLCWLIYNLSGSDSDGIETAVTWIYPFWLLLIGTVDKSTPWHHLVYKYLVTVLLNVASFAVLSLLIWWLYLRIHPGVPRSVE